MVFLCGVTLIAALGWMIGGGSHPAGAVGDSTRLTFKEDSLQDQLRRRLRGAPRGRVVWIRLDNQLHWGPVRRSVDSFLVTRRASGKRSEILEYSGAGRIRRRHMLDRRLVAPPVLDPLGRVVTLSRRGQVQWLDGRLRAQKTAQIRKPSHHPPAVDERGAVFVTHRDGRVTKFDARGRWQWRTSVRGSHPGRPLPLGGGCVLCTGKGKTLVRLGAKGRLKWEARIGACDTQPEPTPHQTLLVSASNWLSAFDRQGRRRWRTPTASRGSLPRRGPRGNLYLVTRAGLLMAVGAKGGLRWTFPVGAMKGTPSPPVVTARSVVVASPHGHLLALSHQGRLRWHHRLPEAPTALTARWDGAVVVVSRGVSIRMVIAPRSSSRPSPRSSSRPSPRSSSRPSPRSSSRPSPRSSSRPSPH